jgi:hypothetical protein
MGFLMEKGQCMARGEFREKLLLMDFVTMV